MNTICTLLQYEIYNIYIGKFQSPTNNYLLYGSGSLIRRIWKNYFFNFTCERLSPFRLT